MCYYNGQFVTRVEYIRLKNLEKLVSQYDFLNREIEIGFNYGQSAVLKPINKLDFEIVKMEWGLIPHYIANRDDLAKFRNGYRDANGKYVPPILTLNAMGEELFNKVSYKEAALKRRCLVLSTGFYEWRHINTINKRTGKPNKTMAKYPYYISVKDQSYFFMAGIWQGWTDKSTGEYVESYSIVTTKANELMQQVHNSKMRMPVILPEDLAFEWIFDDLDVKRITELATFQFPSTAMDAHPIAKDFLSCANPREKTEYQELSPLVY